MATRGNQIIPAGLRADIMRKQMENKNTLAHIGSLYVGVKNTANETISGHEIYASKELYPSAGQKKGQPLVLQADADAKGAEIEWGVVTKDGIGTGAVVGYGELGGASKIKANTITSGDIKARGVQNASLYYDCVYIGNCYYKLVAHSSEKTTQDNKSLTGLTNLSSQYITASTSVSVTASGKTNPATMEYSSNASYITADYLTARNHFNVSSDMRLKEDIKDYHTDRSILDVPVKEFKYKETGSHAIGFIAQDLQKVFPELVHEGKDGYLAIEEGKLVYLLMNEIKQLKEKIGVLEEKLK